MDRRFRESVRRGRGRAGRRSGRRRPAFGAPEVRRSQRVRAGKRGAQRHRSAVEGIQAGRPATEDRRSHWRAGQDFGLHRRQIRMNDTVRVRLSHR